MGAEFWVELIDNIALLLAVSVIYISIPFKYRRTCKTLTFKRFLIKIITGMIIGIIGIASMVNPMHLLPGIIVDVRSIVMTATGMIFGLIPTVVAGMFVSVYRIMQGGAGVLPGMLITVLSAMISLTWRHFRFQKMVASIRRRWVDLVIMNFIVHVFIILGLFTLQMEMALLVMERTALTVLTLYPVAATLLTMLLFTQIDHDKNCIALEESEGRLKTTLLSVGDGVIATNLEGNVTLINTAAEQLTGYSFEEAVGKPLDEIFEIFSEDTGEPMKNPVQKVLSTGKGASLANHTSLVRKDGLTVPIADCAAPIQNQRGETLGAILVVRDATEERRHLEEINYLAFHDVLTGLYNRRFFDEEVSRLDTERNMPMSVIVGDVNGLKLVNDAFGHAVGDELLQRMADELRNSCRDGDIAARWGGDEYIVLLPSTDAAQAEAICARIRENCASVEIAEMNFSMSLGYDTKTDMDVSMRSIIKTAEDYMYQRKSTEGSSIRGNTINTMLRTLHEKNERERMHNERVSGLCRQMAQAMGMTDKEVNELELAGLMHDIGKIAIPEEILNKKGALTDKEWVEIKKHPEIGYRILSASNSMAYIAQYVLKHHERLDGKGYPNGVSGSDIPMQARIISIADAYDAMTSQRTYREPMGTQRAIEELRRCAGTQFDSEIVEVFVKEVLQSGEG